MVSFWLVMITVLIGRFVINVELNIVQSIRILLGIYVRFIVLTFEKLL